MKNSILTFSALIFIFYIIDISYAEMNLYPLYKVYNTPKNENIIAVKDPKNPSFVTGFYKLDDRITIYECRFFNKIKWCQTDKGWIKAKFIRIETYDEILDRQTRMFPMNFKKSEFTTESTKLIIDELPENFPWSPNDIIKQIKNINKIIYAVYIQKNNEILVKDFIEFRIIDTNQSSFSYKIYSQRKQKLLTNKIYTYNIKSNKNNNIIFSPFFPKLKLFKIGVMRYKDNVDACSHNDFTWINTEYGEFVSIGLEGFTYKNEKARIWLIESLPSIAARYENYKTKEIYLLTRIQFKNNKKLYGEYAVYNSENPWTPCPKIKKCYSKKDCPKDKLIYRSKNKYNGKYLFFSYKIQDTGDGCSLETAYSLSYKQYLYPIEINMNKKEFYDDNCYKKSLNLDKKLKVEFISKNRINIIYKGKNFKLFLQK